MGWGERKVRRRGATSLGSPNSSEVFFLRQVGSSRPMTELQSVMTASEPDLLRVEEWYEEGQEELDRGHDIRCLSLRRCYVCRIL